MYRRVVYVALVHVIHISVWALCAKFLAALTIWFAKFQGLLTGGFCGGVATLRPCPPSLCRGYEGACDPCRLRVIWESSNFVKHNKKKSRRLYVVREVHAKY